MKTLFQSLGLSASQINTSTALSVLKDIDNKTSTDLKKGFKLSSSPNLLLLGDSWFAGTTGSAGYGLILAAKLGKNPINCSQSGRTISDVMTRKLGLPVSGNLPGNITVNPAFANYSAIINYGLNDIRIGDQPLYTNAYQYKNCSLASYIACAAPQSKIINARAFTRVGGSIVDLPEYDNFGVEITSGTSYIETTITSRYLAPAFYMTSASLTDKFTPQVIVDGEVVSGQEINYFKEDTAQPQEFYMQTVLVDMGFVATRTVRLIMPTATPSHKFFVAWMATWNGDEANMRDLLVVSPCLWDFQTRNIGIANTASYETYLLVVRGQKEAVKICQNAGLRVFLHEPITAGENLIADNLHLTVHGANTFADEIISDSIF